ncbi:phage tail protein [Cupriavidus gilardii]|uniref:phage tail protein n=1 Tax=Cupriavidus gilardii TaxID=82541 RepID=UPI0021B4795C|nr:phage tail protein [Cupriavidus gilardii]UXC38286.1 phage tail protein [Cupriavidus gilardii]
MSVRLPNGSIFAIASALAAATPVTALTNAAPPIATAAGHTLIDGDIVTIASGWTRLDGRIGRVDAAAADNFALEGFDATSTLNYPPGSGAGSVRKINTWTEIRQTLTSTSQGGEQQFYTYSFLEDTGDDKQIPTTRSARSITLTIADDPTLPQYAVLKEADEDREPRPIRFLLPNGDAIYFMAYVSMSDMPTTTKNEAMAITVTLSLLGKPTRYNAAGA